MSNLCRLCLNICKDYRNLYDDYGRDNETYEITVKYFDPTFLDVERGNHLTVVCLGCWRHIIEFHNFRQSVLQAHTNLFEDGQQVESPLKNGISGAASEILYDDIVVKVEDEFLSPPELGSIPPAIYYPSEECTTHGTSELFYGYIVKEEVEFISPPDVGETAVEFPAEECKSRRATRELGNNSIFLTDEQELSSLVKSTPTKIFPKCVTKTEPILENMETKPTVNMYKEHPADDSSGDDDYDARNVSSSDETYKQSQSEDDEDPVSTITCGNVIKDDDDELMDISESELDSLAVYGNSDHDDDDVYLPKFASKLRRMSTKVKSEPTTFAGTRKSTVRGRISTANARASHKDLQARNASEKLLIKRMAEEQQFEHSVGEPVRKMPTKRPIKSKREEELDDVIAQWRPNLDCMICSETYTSYTLLQQHFREKHVNEEFYVLCCDLKIKKRGHLAEHIRLHIDHKAFKCEFCDKRCTRKRNLRLHMSKKHGITDSGVICQREQNNDTLSKSQNIARRKLKDSDEFIAQWLPNLECVVCKITCTSFTLLQEHFRQQHSESECYIICCECKLNQRSVVAEHLREHTHPRVFKCELCDGCFTMKRTLDYHMRTEHPTTPDKGGIAPKEYGDNASLKGDDMSTTNCNEKASKNQIPKKIALNESDDLISQWLPTLECGICKKSCMSFTLLQAHFDQMHPDGDGYVLCCQRKFFKRYKLLDHCRNHLYSKAFKCELCGKRYSSNLGLQLHISKQHHISKDGINSSHDNGSVSSNDVQDHYKIKTELLNKSNKRKSIKELDEIIAQWRPNLECMVCGETCTTYTLLQDHFRQQHPNKECHISCCRCKFAGRYDIEEHIRFHNDPNAFKCPYCGKCFSRRRALNGHLRTHSST